MAPLGDRLFRRGVRRRGGGVRRRGGRAAGCAPRAASRDFRRFQASARRCRGGRRWRRSSGAAGAGFGGRVLRRTQHKHRLASLPSLTLTRGCSSARALRWRRPLRARAASVSMPSVDSVGARRVNLRRGGVDERPSAVKAASAVALGEKAAYALASVSAGRRLGRGDEHRALPSEARCASRRMSARGRSPRRSRAAFRAVPGP